MASTAGSVPPRSALRALPPLALAIVVAAVLLVVTSGLGVQAAPDPATRATTTTSSSSTSSRRTYRVRRGDDLSTVASRFGVTLQDLTALNPRVDPQSVSIGTRLRLRR